jgi:hypothetical protein
MGKRRNQTDFVGGFLVDQISRRSKQGGSKEEAATQTCTSPASAAGTSPRQCPFGLRRQAPVVRYPVYMSQAGGIARSTALALDAWTRAPRQGTSCRYAVGWSGPRRCSTVVRRVSSLGTRAAPTRRRARGGPS